jgi:hypothetical protein
MDDWGMPPNNLLPFPKVPVQAIVPTELTMVHEIQRDQVSLDLLLEKISMAGFEARIEDDDIYFVGTGCSTRVDILPEAGVVRIRGLYMLNNQLNDAAADAFCAFLNKRLTVSKFVTHRWDDGDLGLFISHCVQYNFGLNMPNLLFSVRRFIESCQSLYRTDILGTRFDPDFKPAELELVSKEVVATMQ